jgi:cytochrome o ubiquinol oxidase subunit 3
MSDSYQVHHTRDPLADTRVPDIHQDVFSKTTLGFWMYLMTDCLIFATLFTTYAVLHNNTFGGPSSRELYHLPTAFTETMILLVSSLTCGLALLSSLRSEKHKILGWLAVTFLLGASFVGIELNEFMQMVHEGNSWRRSAFLSSFFTLVGTHGLHVSIGLLWMTVMMGQVYWLGVTVDTFRRLVVFNLFWHFLDLVWIFIFSFVYLLGVV